MKRRGNEIDKRRSSKWAVETAVIMVFSRMSGIQMEAGWSRSNSRDGSSSERQRFLTFFYIMSP